MEIGAKTIAAGVAVFLLGVGSTYWLMADNGKTTTSATPQRQPAMQAALAQLGSTPSNSNETDAGNDGTQETDAIQTTSESTADAGTLTHERFLAAAEARREQQLADKAEADRMAKLRQQKADSVDCKFWRQQQQTSSTAAKIEEKIKTHCMLASDLASSESSSSAETVTP
ncbi:hypothetical protein [Cellvibrio sp. PSBB023]|uniref:hypothetical protein n=1 Tax=Cellvibrio sp. PSBB023 TaxID=1945512 RepID=UPI00098FC82A|nr:hypothetical protein [Cellvibrio sp. PSBB023]AQT60675.1 hypothetical protein B0D95_11750 [Cellvibrio sp. PSBB023]